jgi:hypothetical protein
MHGRSSVEEMECYWRGQRRRNEKGMAIGLNHVICLSAFQTVRTKEERWKQRLEIEALSRQ